jgi:hypothetical protein
MSHAIVALCPVIKPLTTVLLTLPHPKDYLWPEPLPLSWRHILHSCSGFSFFQVFLLVLDMWMCKQILLVASSSRCQPNLIPMDNVRSSGEHLNFRELGLLKPVESGRSLFWYPAQSKRVAAVRWLFGQIDLVWGEF